MSDDVAGDAAGAVGGDMLERLARLQAELENLRKRVEREKRDAEALAGHRLMAALLRVVDEMELARGKVASLSDEGVRKGVLMVFDNLREALEKEGLEEMRCEGAPFDPFLHEAALREDSPALAGIVLRVLKTGYLLNGKVLRHAVVSVSTGAAADASGTAAVKAEGKVAGNAAGNSSVNDAKN
ncbi:MAG: nucleotide exchange factor GrpE [Candidatus Micrarchaeota archaeon]